MRRICTILARGGSKGLPNKNLLPLHGMPLIAHTICQAQETGIFEAITVSSDSLEIIDVARQWNADHLIRRPSALATDHAAKLPAIEHCVAEVERLTDLSFDVIVDLDPTAPLRLASDVRAAAALLEARDVSCVITGSEARKSPYFHLVECDEDGVPHLSKPPPVTVQRRQDNPRCYDMNAAVYVWRRKTFQRDPRIFYPDTLLHQMPTERSHDIDTPLDFAFVEFLMDKRRAS